MLCNRLDLNVLGDATKYIASPSKWHDMTWHDIQHLFPRARHICIALDLGDQDPSSTVSGLWWFHSFTNRQTCSSAAQDYRAVKTGHANPSRVSPRWSTNKKRCRWIPKRLRVSATIGLLLTVFPPHGERRPVIGYLPNGSLHLHDVLYCRYTK